MVLTLTSSEIDSLLPYLRREGLLQPGQSFDARRDLTLAHRSSSGQITGLLCLRPMFYAHSLTVPSRSRFITNQLVDFGHDLAKMASVHGTLFQVASDNASMIAYIESRGAVAEPNSVLYRLDRVDIGSSSRRRQHDQSLDQRSNHISR